MRIFVYEHLTGGGLLTANAQTNLQSLAREGAAMRHAVASDLSRIDGVEVICLRDARQTTWRSNGCRVIDVDSVNYERAFDRSAAESDWTLVIAPEIGGALAERCRRVVAVGGRLLASSPQTIAIASDKHATAEHLGQSGVPSPHGIPFLLGEPWPLDVKYPAIWKPRDGAGSDGLRRVENFDVPIPAPDGRLGRLEELCTPAYRSPQAPREESRSPISVSVSFLCGPAKFVSLPPSAQRLDDRFRYLGGWLPLPPPLAARATGLARRVIETLPEPLGYLGVDLVLGEATDGSQDVVIEINPRLTTSYIGLRAACHNNLAAAMLAIASGEPYNLSFRDDRVEFIADGSCRVLAC